MLEAAITKNLLVLNDDVESLHEFGGPRIESYASMKNLYFSFGSLTRSIGSYHPDEATWYMDHARLLMEMQSQDRALMFFKHVRKKHNPKWVYTQQLLPILQEKFRELANCEATSDLQNHEIITRADQQRKSRKAGVSQ